MDPACLEANTNSDTILPSLLKMQMSSPYEIASQSRAYHRGIPCSVNILLIRSHTELFQDHWLVGRLLRGGVVGDPLLAPGGTGGVGGFAPAFLQSIDQYLSNSFLWKQGVLRGITTETVARKFQLGKQQQLKRTWKVPKSMVLMLRFTLKSIPMVPL